MKESYLHLFLKFNILVQLHIFYFIRVYSGKLIRQKVINVAKNKIEKFTRILGFFK